MSEQFTTVITPRDGGRIVLDQPNRGGGWAYHVTDAVGATHEGEEPDATRAAFTAARRYERALILAEASGLIPPQPGSTCGLVKAHLASRAETAACTDEAAELAERANWTELTTDAYEGRCCGYRLVVRRLVAGGWEWIVFAHPDRVLPQITGRVVTRDAAKAAAEAKARSRPEFPHDRVVVGALTHDEGVPVAVWDGEEGVPPAENMAHAMALSAKARRQVHPNTFDPNVPKLEGWRGTVTLHTDRTVSGYRLRAKVEPVGGDTEYGSPGQPSRTPEEAREHERLAANAYRAAGWTVEFRDADRGTGDAADAARPARSVDDAVREALKATGYEDVLEAVKAWYEAGSAYDVVRDMGRHGGPECRALYEARDRLVAAWHATLDRDT